MNRIFDIVLSFIGLIIVSPVFLFIIIFRTIVSKGSVFFLQTRVGKGGKDFTLYKFRTMNNDADKKGELTVGEKDSRITPAGFFLRKYKLDELPQLINVLIGDMSLVGPRPEIRKYVDLYNKEQMHVFLVKPGITDYASLEYFDENELLGNAENPEEFYIKEVMPAKLKLNIKYIREKNIFTDIKIIFLTVLRIFR